MMDSMIWFLILQLSTLQSVRRIQIIRTKTFKVNHENDQFVKDGRPFQIFSGAFHYFRVDPQRWDHVLKQAKAMGLNTIESYIPWSLHEPIPGKYDFSGRHDLMKFISLVHQNNLLFIARVGPYSCAEMDMGGLPAWLRNKTSEVRSSDQGYLSEVEKWLNHLLPMLIPYFYSNWGPITMIQMENEYGSYGCDQDYLQKLESLFRNHINYDVTLFTVDGCFEKLLKCGGIDTVFRTPDFGIGTNVQQCFQNFRKVQKTGPMLVMEYYTGWFTNWGGEHSKTDGTDLGRTLEEIISQNHSVNLYMFMGGTNYNFQYSGSNVVDSKFQSQITSYDYDGPLDQSGNPTYKFYILRYVFGKYSHTKLYPVQKTIPRIGNVKSSITKSISLLDVIDLIKDDSIVSDETRTMEEIQYYTGFVLYSSNKLYNVQNMSYAELQDSMTLSVNTTGTLFCRRNQPLHHFHLVSPLYGNVHLTLHNEGRPNYGHYLLDNKGVTGVEVNGNEINSWKIRPFLQNDSKIKKISKLLKNWNDLVDAIPGFYQTTFTLSAGQLLDTYVYLHGFSKGVIYVNNRSIGRYDYILGPQYSFYIPETFLKPGDNEILIFETVKASCFNAYPSCHILLNGFPVWK